MPLYKKSILRVGTYHSPDGTVRVTPARLKHWALMHRKLAVNDQVVPIDWDHAADPTTAVPMSADRFSKQRRSAKNTVGHLKRFKLAKDGRSAEIVMDIHRKSAAQAADDNSVFVSPVIFDRWKDGHGNDYEDVITHVDFVNHPVDASQTKFEPCPAGAVACALRFGLGSGTPNVYRFELDDEDEDEEDKKKKKSDDDEDDDDDLDIDIDMDDDEDAAEDDLGGFDDDLIDEPDITEMSDPVPPVEPVVAAATPDMAADEQLAQQIAADLEAAGIAPPEGVNPISDAKGFLSQLCAALRQKAMDASKEEEPAADDPTDALGDPSDNGGGSLTETSPEFAAMSLGRQQDKARIAALEQRFITLSRDQRLADLTGLLNSGRITADEFNQHAKTVRTVSMSLGKDGNPVRVSADEFIAARQSVPAGCMWPVDSELRLSLDAQLTEPSGDLMGVLSPEEAKKFVDAQAARMGGMIQTRS